MSGSSNRLSSFSESQSKPDSDLENSSPTGSNAVVPAVEYQRQHPGPPLLVQKYVFDRRIRRRLNLVWAGEDSWFQLWHRLLYRRLFREKDGFVIDITCDENWIPNFGFVGHYAVKLRGDIVACVIEILPSDRNQSALCRVQAYEQLKYRLLKCTKDYVGIDGIDVVYGLQFLGDHFMIARMNPKQRSITPSLYTHLRHTNFAEVAPKRWWCHDLTKRRGRKRLIDLANELRVMLRMCKPVESTQSSLREDSKGSLKKPTSAS